MAFSLITSNAGAIVTVRSRLSLHLRRSFCTITATSASREMAKVGVVQMTSTNDLEANFLTCSRLVKEAAVEGVKLLLTLRSYCCHWYSERKYQISHASWYSERKYQISHATGTLRSYCYCCHWYCDRFALFIPFCLDYVKYCAVSFSTCMNQKHLARLIQFKFRKKPDEILLHCSDAIYETGWSCSADSERSSKIHTVPSLAKYISRNFDSVNKGQTFFLRFGVDANNMDEVQQPRAKWSYFLKGLTTKERKNLDPTAVPFVSVEIFQY